MNVNIVQIHSLLTTAANESDDQETREVCQKALDCLTEYKVALWTLRNRSRFFVCAGDLARSILKVGSPKINHVNQGVHICRSV